MVLYIIYILATLSIEVNGQGMGPFDLMIRSFEKCPESLRGTDQIRVQAKLHRISRTKFVANINATFEVPFSNELEGKVIGAIQTSQGWKDNFIVFDSPKVCQITKKYVPNIIPDIMKSIGLHRRDCPLPVGNYTFSLPLAFDLRAIPIFTYNKYRFRVYLIENQVVICCMQAAVDIVPKRVG